MTKSTKPTPPLRRDKATLTDRERIFIVEYVRNGGIGSHAAKFSGVPDSIAKSWASKTLRKPRVNSAVRDMLSRNGLTDELLYALLHQQLKATKTVNVKGADGRWDTAQDPDWKARGEALEKAFKIRGDYAPQKHRHELVDPLAGMDEAQKEALFREAQALLAGSKDSEDGTGIDEANGGER